MTKYTKASDEVIHIAQAYIKKHHEDLQDARILFLFREEAARSQGKIVYGKARKPPSWLSAIGDWDFLIEIAEDRWDDLSREQREALIDHELCHCDYSEGKPKMRPHDIEEFREILDRHGLWNMDLFLSSHSLPKATQLMLPTFGKEGNGNGSVETTDIEVEVEE